MAALFDRILQRPGGTPPPEDLEELVDLATEERTKLAGLLEAVDSKTAPSARRARPSKHSRERLTYFSKQHEALQNRLTAAQDLATLLSALEARTHQVEGLARDAEGRMDEVDARAENAQKASQIMQQLLVAGKEAERQIAEYRERARELAGVDAKVGGLNEQLEHFESRAGSIVDDYKRLSGPPTSYAPSSASSARAALRSAPSWTRPRAWPRGSRTCSPGSPPPRAWQGRARSSSTSSTRSPSTWRGRSRSLGATQQALERADAQSRQVNELVYRIEQRVQEGHGGLPPDPGHPGQGGEPLEAAPGPGRAPGGRPPGSGRTWRRTAARSASGARASSRISKSASPARRC